MRVIGGNVLVLLQEIFGIDDVLFGLQSFEN